MQRMPFVKKNDLNTFVCNFNTAAYTHIKNIRC